MASPVNAVLGALLATAFWTVLGHALARRVLPRALAIGAAPVVGWAAFSAASLPILTLIGFSEPAVIALAVVALVVAGGSLVVAAPLEAAAAPTVPASGFAAAAILACVPASAIVPKFSGHGIQLGVHLAAPMFDHSKIAIIDAMARQGLPPVNPVFGESGAAGHLAYYYLWHFSAAELALPLRITGWEADIGLTWFTAFASLASMMGIAVWLGNRASAAFAVVALAAAASLRGALQLLTGSYKLEPFLASPNGFAGWLFQSAWVPQHLMSASCVVTAMVLLALYAQRQDATRLLTLGLLAAAGFESSAYVGGVTFAVAALAAAPILFAGVPPQRRLRIAGELAAAAVLAVCLAAPFIRDQLATVAARGGGSPVGFHPFEVLGDMVPAAFRRALDAPAYWLILLPIEFPATFIAGAIGLAAMLRGAATGAERAVLAVLIALTVAGLAISWLLVGTLGDNNDLGLRAVLPVAMVLIVGAAAGMMRMPRRRLIAGTALAGLVLSLPDGGQMLRSNVAGTVAPDDRSFAQAADLWAAVRRYASPSARVANNPLYLQDLTPWPANMSWALLADRSSCFAGRELALAFAALPWQRREAINAQFVRVFAGQGTPADVDELAKKFSCEVVVIVPQDGAWSDDPFAASRDYRLAEFRDGRWRIYVRAPDGARP